MADEVVRTRRRGKGISQVRRSVEMPSRWRLVRRSVGGSSADSTRATVSHFLQRGETRDGGTIGCGGTEHLLEGKGKKRLKDLDAGWKRRNRGGIRDGNGEDRQAPRDGDGEMGMGMGWAGALPLVQSAVRLRGREHTVPAHKSVDLRLECFHLLSRA